MKYQLFTLGYINRCIHAFPGDKHFLSGDIASLHSGAMVQITLCVLMSDSSEPRHARGRQQILALGGLWSSQWRHISAMADTQSLSFIPQSANDLLKRVFSLSLRAPTKKHREWDSGVSNASLRMRGTNHWVRTKTEGNNSPRSIVICWIHTLVDCK